MNGLCGYLFQPRQRRSNNGQQRIHEQRDHGWRYAHTADARLAQCGQLNGHPCQWRHQQTEQSDRWNGLNHIEYGKQSLPQTSRLGHAPGQQQADDQGRHHGRPHDLQMAQNGWHKNIALICIFFGDGQVLALIQ